MRRLRTAATPFGWCVCVALMGCSHDNPGFKVKGSADGSGASETSVSGSGVTSETSVSSTPTTGTPDTTTSGPGITSTTGLTQTSSGGSESSTGGNPPVFPLLCDENSKQVVGFPVAADTYFSFNANDPGQCDDLSEYCKNTNTGRVSYRDVFNRDDYLTAFAVRFTTEPLEYMGFPVPHEVVKLTLQLFVEREDQEHPNDVKLFTKRFGANDASWPEGDNYALEPCHQGDSSYACRSCNDDTSCAQQWAVSLPEIISSKAVADAIVVPKSYAQLTDVPLVAGQELPFFAEGHPGFLVVGEAPVYEGKLIIKAHEVGEAFAPQLIAEYCKPVE
jgi:hypothetical protein